MHSDQTAILDTVAKWAEGYILLREIGLFLSFQESCRIDGLLVPINWQAHCMKWRRENNHWGSPCLVGIEVKTNRPDFVSGLRGGQFTKYQRANLSALYIATFHGVCKTKEIPNDIGHLVVYYTEDKSDYRCVCKRHPKYTEVAQPVEMVWKLLFKVMADWKAGQDKKDQEAKKRNHRVGELAGKHVFNALQCIEDRVCKESC